MPGPRRTRSRWNSISSPSIGNKINITMAAEAQAKTGHDVYAFDSWTVQQYGDSLDADGRRDEVADREIRQAGARLRIPRCRQWALAGGAGRLGFRAADAVRAHQPDEEVRQHRRAGLVSGARGVAGHREGLDLRHAAEVRRGVVQERLSDRLRLRLRQHRRQPDLGRDVRCVRRRSGGRQGQHHHRFGQRDGGDGVLPEDGEVHAAGRGELGRRLEQPRADLRQGGADLEPAVRLGGGQARCAAGGGGLLDLPESAGTEGPAGAASAVFLGRLVVLAEPERGARRSSSTCRSASRSSRWPPRWPATTSRRSNRCPT